MINEKERAEELLNGIPFKKEYFFSAYVILIKYFKYKGFDAFGIRKEIEKWEKKYNNVHYFDLNKIILNILSKHNVFRTECNVKINKNDIIEIKDRFDNKRVQKVALSILCYVKANACKEVYLSLPALAQFANVSYNTLRGNYFTELIDFRYIEKMQNKPKKWGWEDEDMEQADYKQLKIKLLVPFENHGEYVLHDNDITTFYKGIF